MIMIMIIIIKKDWHCLTFSFMLFPQDDGAIRVWKNFADLEKNPEMVTACQGLSDMLPTTRGRCDLIPSPHLAKNNLPQFGVGLGSPAFAFSNILLTSVWSFWSDLISNFFPTIF